MARAIRLLAVDDSLTMRKLLEVVFSAPAFELSLATSGAEAIAAAARLSPEIVVMDYVLPDMMGIDICSALSRNESTKNIPLLVTSAKGAKILEEFKSYPSVAGFVPKPFKPAEIKAAVIEALKVRAKPEADMAGTRITRRETPKPALAEMEKIARALFGVLAPSFVKFPEWMAEMGAERPDRFFGRKLLTPRSIESLLDALRPFVQPTDSTPASDLSGTTELVPLVELLSLVASSRRNGTLRLTHDNALVQAYFRQGQLLVATHNDPAAYMAGVDGSRWRITPELRARAEDAHRKNGAPVLVTYAEAGALPLPQLAGLLKDTTRSTLLRALDGHWRFSWSDGALPSYADSHGTPVSLDSLKLDHLRHSDSEEASVDWSPSQLLVRQPGFTQRAKSIELDADERKVLTLVNNRHPLREVVERSGLEPKRAMRVLHRLHKVGLIGRTAAAAQRDASIAGESRGKVVVCEADRTSTAGLLSRHLTDSQGARDVVLVEAPDQIEAQLDATLEALIVNCSAAGFDFAKLAKRVRASLEMADATLVAVVEPSDVAHAEALRAAGYDGVLVKPFLLDELDALLAAA